MKLNLTKKIVIYSLISNLVVAASIGGTLYKYAGESYYQAFINSKESLANAIALSIDGDRHKSFTSLDSSKDREYLKYLKYLNTIRLSEKFVTYLFTINYDRKNDRLTYIVDSDINPTDVIWITTEFFGFALSINKDNQISIKYNEVIYSEDFVVNIKGKKIPLKIDIDGTLYLGGNRLVKVVSKSPLMLEVYNKKLDHMNREFYSKIFIGDIPAELYCSFTAKGESQSIPGELYAESRDVVEQCKQIITGQKSTVVRREAPTSIYGANIATAYGIIKDGKGVANGLVVIELFHGEVSDFKSSIALISLAVSMLLFIFTIILTFILAQYIIIPIKKLTRGAQKVSDGDLNCKIKINRSDELGVLADTFNGMLLNINNAHNQLTSANDELNKYKNNLELLVEERTAALTKSNTELQYALTEVKELKGMLPICSSCKKIREDNGYWSQIENYISRHSRAEFTHSICPSCAKKLYPNLNINVPAKENK